jgi:hypothetical protein
MFPFINREKNIIFWWSAKAGCSTVKSIMFEMINKNNDCKSWKDEEFHKPIAKGKIDLKNAQSFTNILFIRDPYKRFISGIIDKNIRGELSKFYKPKNILDASQNIDSLCRWRHHFSPQSSEHFIPNLKFNYVYDIEKINYEELSSICNFHIVERKKNQAFYRNNLDNKFIDAYLLDYNTLVSLKLNKNIPSYQYFYSSDVKENIHKYYYKDFILFQEYNFYYNISTIDQQWNEIFIINEPT